jgi:hypothetical protein
LQNPETGKLIAGVRVVKEKIMKKNLSILSKTFLALLISASFVACDKDDDDDTGNIMVTHASPNAPGVDLLVDNVKQNSSPLTFPNSTSYLEVNEGTRNIKVNAAGTSTTVIDANITIVEDRNYSIFAINNLASISPIVVEDNLAAPASGNAHLRFFHLSPGAPSVTVGYLTGATFTPLFSDRAFETQATATTNAAFTPVPAGTYTVDVRVAGTSTSVLNVPGVVLQAGKIYTVFARGVVGSATTPLSASVITHN